MIEIDENDQMLSGRTDYIQDIMGQLNLNNIIKYIYQVRKARWAKAVVGREEASNQRTVVNHSLSGTNDQEPASRIQHPVSSIRHPVTRKQRPASGFTLLEVLIAMAIMAIVLVSVYRMHSQTLNMTAASRFYTQAPMLAQSKMSQLEANPSDVIAGDSGDFGEQFPGYSWRVSTEDVTSEILGDTAGDLKRIDLTVALNENEYEYSVRTYLFVRE